MPFVGLATGEPWNTSGQKVQDPGQRFDFFVPHPPETVAKLQDCPRSPERQRPDARTNGFSSGEASAALGQETIPPKFLKNLVFNASSFSSFSGRR
jgi:hypothetical protein